MEYIVFLVGLGLFVAYPRIWVLIAAVAASVLTAIYAPRVEMIDAIGNVWWLPGAYGLVASVLLYAGFAGVFERINRAR